MRTPANAAAALASDHPFDVVLVRLAQRGCRLQRPTPDCARAICPRHRDIRPSLVVTRKTDRVLLHCFAGCRTTEVANELGLRMSDLFVQGQVQRERPRVVAQYDYRDLDGRLIAQKVRREPKSFRWRRPDPLREDGWFWELGDARPGLYRIEQLIDVRRVFCVEGEKAVDRLWEGGVPATCPPSGAGVWQPAWSEDLWRAGCCELVILPDADRPGHDHAERVAHLTHALQHSAEVRMTVKVIALPGLRTGEDVVDWLHADHTCAELLQLAADAPEWEPGAAERARRDRRRELVRERVRRYRERQRALRRPGVVPICNAANVRKR